MKIMKRIVAILLVSVMVLAFTGCAGDEEPGGVKTLVVAVTHANQRDTEIVEAALNKKLETLLPGIQIDLIEQDTDKWNYWMSSNYRVDIAWTGYAYDMSEQIRMGAYMELDDLIANYAPNIQNEMKTYALDYDTGRYTDGKLYAIPNQQPFISETPYLIIPAEVIQYFDVEGFLAETKKSPYTTRAIYEILDDYFEALVANNALNTDYVGKYMDPGYLVSLIAMRGYYDMGNGVYYKVWNDDGTVVTTPNFQNQLDTDAYKLWMEYAARWHELGYMPPSTSIYGASGTQMCTLSGHVNGMWDEFDDPDDNEELGLHAVYDSWGNVTAYNLNIEPRDYSHSYNPGATLGAEKTYMVIPATAKYPEEAMQLLNLLRDPIGEPGNDFLNMLVYGFAKDSPEAQQYGVYHYTLDGDQITSEEYVQQASSSTTYGQPHWSVGNVYLTYRTQLITDGMKEYALEYDTATRFTFPTIPTAGFVFDKTNYIATINSISTVSTEYAARVMYGIENSGTAALAQKYREELKKAGYDNLVAEYVKQYNNWKAGK